MELIDILGIGLTKQGFQLPGACPNESVAFRQKLTQGLLKKQDSLRGFV